MNKIAIIGDSTCDLTTEIRKSRNIDYCRMPISWYDDDKKFVETYADLDWEQYSVHQFYEWLRHGYVIKTAQVTEQEFDRVFVPHLKKGEDIVYIACSGALSGSVRAAEKLAKEKYSKEYPNCHIYCVDSLCACLGQGAMVVHAADMRDEGKDAKTIAEFCTKNRLRWNQAAAIDTLTYLKRAGRVKAAKALFGNLFGVKPLLISDANGINFAAEKAKGRRNALIRCAEMIHEQGIDTEHQICYIEHAECSDEDVELLKNKIDELCHFKEYVIAPLGPIIGASCGPNTIAAFVYGKEETRVGE